MLFDTIKDLYDKKNYKGIKEIFETMNDADIADLFGHFHDNEEIEKREFPMLFRLLPKDAAADMKKAFLDLRRGK